MTHKVIGFEIFSGIQYRPYIPEIYYTISDNIIHKITREAQKIISKTEYQQKINLNYVSKVNNQIFSKSGYWICVEEGDNIIWIPRNQEPEWRFRNAERLIHNSAGKKPVDSIKLLLAAAHLMKMSLPQLTKELNQNRLNSNESFEEIFRRIHKK